MNIGENILNDPHYLIRHLTFEERYEQRDFNNLYNQGYKFVCALGTDIDGNIVVLFEKRDTSHDI